MIFDRPQFLLLLARELTALGVRYNIIAQGTSEPHTFLRDEDRAAEQNITAQPLEPQIHDARVPHLAQLRNRVLEPLLASELANAFTTVVFMNDVFHCASDVLELLYQRRKQQADMACGLDFFSDWMRSRVVGEEFYDTWVARAINGLQLSTPGKYPMSAVPSEASAEQFLSQSLETLGRIASLHPPSRARYVANLPFQVFSCWNGMGVINARAFQPPHNLRFRSIDYSDYASESYLFNVDLWKQGLGKIMVVPSVKLAYNLQDYKVLQKVMARTQRRQQDKDDAWEVTLESLQTSERIKWVQDPPDLVDFRPYNRHRPLFEEVGARFLHQRLQGPKLICSLPPLSLCSHHGTKRPLNIVIRTYSPQSVDGVLHCVVVTARLRLCGKCSISAHKCRLSDASILPYTPFFDVVAGGMLPGIQLARGAARLSADRLHACIFVRPWFLGQPTHGYSTSACSSQSISPKVATVDKVDSIRREPCDKECFCDLQSVKSRIINTKAIRAFRCWMRACSCASAGVTPGFTVCAKTPPPPPCGLAWPFDHPKLRPGKGNNPAWTVHCWAGPPPKSPNGLHSP